MRVPRSIGRAAPLLAAGAAAAWYLRARGGSARRRSAAGIQPEDPVERHASAVERVSDASDVISVVEDLLAPAPGEPGSGSDERRTA
jgi:hypothetical protein